MWITLLTMSKLQEANLDPISFLVFANRSLFFFLMTDKAHSPILLEVLFDGGTYRLLRDEQNLLKPGFVAMAGGRLS